MTIAVPSRPRRIDPLLAATPVDRLVAGQIYEPLTSSLSGPYDDVRRVPGLALSVRPAEGRRLWRVRLRPDVRFQDGRPLDAAAVVANAERWLTTSAGRVLLPGLTAADAPRPDLVRLILDRPLPDLPRRLASPRLGIVSPGALEPGSGVAATVRTGARAGTGAFELRGEGAPESCSRETPGGGARATAWGPRSTRSSCASLPMRRSACAFCVAGRPRRLGACRRVSPRGFGGIRS